MGRSVLNYGRKAGCFDVDVDTPVTFAVNELGEVIALHADGTSDLLRNGLRYPGNKSALKGFRHLGRPE